jgi:hypothetical protein
MARAEDDRAGEGFLSRWSRLKREAREGAAPADPPAERPPAEVPPAPPPGRAAAEAEETVDLGALPRLEDLTAESDITAFLRKGVPVGLRNAALRRVWSLDPAIRDYIGPVDYGWDWNTPGGVPDFVDSIGEGPEIRALAEKLFSPVPPPRPAPAEQGETREPEAGPEPARLAAEPPAPAVPADPVQAAAPAEAGPSERPEPAAPPPPPRPRHGGALPA